MNNPAKKPSGCVRIGLYGSNGHQLPLSFPASVRAQVIAVVDGAVDPDGGLPDSVRRHATLEALLDDPAVDLVSLCSPRRVDQAADALRCLAAGKHVLAEKPCVFHPEILDHILAMAAQNNCAFREMGGMELAPPLQAIRRLVDAGELGTIVQVQAQKSYPWHDRRSSDIAVDGGLVRQTGIHAVRYIHGATGLRMARVRGVSTPLGNPGPGGLAMAAAFVVELENGGVGTINLNYLNPSNFGAWGNDMCRVFGTKGMAESVDGFRRHALYLPERGDRTELPIPQDLPTPLYIEHYVNFLLDGTPMPTSFEEEVAMTRAMLALHFASLSPTGC
ncbi:MAG: Gfo/Idh/MocA family protein [Kiritimatiellia bacterium]